MENLISLTDYPELRMLLINYCNSLYEENAILDDYHLICEYDNLCKNDSLHLIYNV